MRVVPGPAAAHPDETVKLQARAADEFTKHPDPKVRGVLIYGPDEGQVRERAAAIARCIVPDANDPFHIADLTPEDIGSDPTRLVDEATSLSMLGGRRLIRLAGATDKLAPACAGLEAVPTGTDSLVVVEGGDLNPRSALRKLFEGGARLAAIACYVDDAAGLARVIRETLAADKIMPDLDAVAYLASSLLGDRALARRALEKLSLYLGTDGKTLRKLTLGDAIAAVGDAAALDLDDPVRAAAEGDRVQTDRALARLLEEGTAPVAILRVAQTYFRRLHQARAAWESGQSLDTAMSGLRPPVFFKQVPQFRRQVERWKLPLLGQALDRLVECEAATKETGAPAELLLGRTFIRLAQLQREAHRAS